MIKIFLVEDEVIVRNGIKDSIDWEREGIEFSGEAADGELALPLIKKTAPDILITDIKMPFMDGIELSKAVHKLYPGMKIIILSGYSEFTYAQEAIKIGIEEYLLKPISSEKLLETIRKVSESVRREQEDKDLRERYSKENEENQSYQKYCFFNKIIKGEMPVSEILSEAVQLNMDLSASRYCYLFFKFRKVENGGGFSASELHIADEIDQEVLKREGIYSYDRGIEGKAFVVLGEDDQSIQERIDWISGKLIAIVETNEKMEYFGSIGNVVHRLSELGNSYHEANRRFANRFVRSWNQFVAEEKETSEQTVNLGNVMDTSQPIEMAENRYMLESFLKTGTKEESKDFMGAFLNHMSMENLKSNMFRQYIVMDIYFCIESFEEKLDVEPENLVKNHENINELSKHIQSVESTKNYLTELLKHCILVRDEKAGRKYSDIINTACLYIKQHFMEEHMSLNVVAKEANMSPSYFSSIFSREVGQTFIEYLTAIRMEKAKELLMCSAMKTSEIAFEVGYKDAHYFSYIFKKTQKCSPKEYRLRRGE